MLVKDTKGRVLTDTLGRPMTSEDRQLSSAYFYVDDTSELTILIETYSGNDFVVNWGDGSIQIISSASPGSSLYTTHNYDSSYTGDVIVSTPDGLSDIYRFQSVTGGWNFSLQRLKQLPGLRYFSFFNSKIYGDIIFASHIIERFLSSSNDTNIWGAIDARIPYIENIRVTGDNNPLKIDLDTWNGADVIRVDGALTEANGNISGTYACSSVFLDFGFGNVTGSINGMTSVTYVWLSGAVFNLTGDISNYQNIISTLRLAIANSNLTYTSTTWSSIPTSVFLLRLDLGCPTQSELDNLLTDLEATGDSGNGALDFRGENAPIPTATAAITALQSRGWTVLVNS